MKKHDFELIANILNTQQPAEVDKNFPWYRMVIAFATKLEIMYHSFDKKRFLELCGIEED